MTAHDPLDDLRHAPTSPAPPVSRGGSGVRTTPTLATLPPPAPLPSFTHFDGRSVHRCSDPACGLCVDDSEEAFLHLEACRRDESRFAYAGPSYTEEDSDMVSSPARVPCRCGDGTCMLCDDEGFLPAEVAT